MKLKIIFTWILLGLLLGACVSPQEHWRQAELILAQAKEGGGVWGEEEKQRLLYHLQQAADIPEACYALARSYELEGRRAESRKWLQRAAQLGLAKAQYDLGKLELNCGQVVSGLAWLEKAAASGNPAWLMELYVLYSHPTGAAADSAKAFMFALAAAERGRADAQKAVGYCYSQGEGVEKDYRQALIWFERAAQAGDAQAMNILGIMHEYGQGTAQDFAQAVYWYEKAVALGLPSAYTNLAVFYVYSAPARLRQPDKGFALLRQAAQRGNVRAKSVMGECYQFGVGVARDLKQAFFWQNLAHEEGYEIASYYLGRMYLDGVGVVKRPDEALRLFKLAAERETWGGAACMLGDMYRRGLDGKAPAYGAALNWYTRAARQNNQRAMYQLGLMYEKGLGVSRNLSSARGWYEKALSLSPDELRPNYTEQSLSSLDPVAATIARARKALRRLGG